MINEDSYMYGWQHWVSLSVVGLSAVSNWVPASRSAYREGSWRYGGGGEVVIIGLQALPSRRYGKLISTSSPRRHHIRTSRALT